MPEVSVIIPAYNAAHYLKDAVASVLAQTFKDFELIVVDDGSRDETGEVAQGFGDSIRYFYQSNSGVSAARNRGIAESRGRFVAFLDADDTWFPEKLEQQLRALAESPSGPKACYSNLLKVKPDLTPITESRSPHSGRTLHDLVTLGNVVGTPSTVVVERALFETTGGFDPKLSQSADWDMWIRLSQLTNFLHVDQVLVKYRLHDANMSRDTARIERDNVRVLTKVFAMPGLPATLLAGRRKALARVYTVLAGCYFHDRRIADFVRCAIRSMVLDVRKVGYLCGHLPRVLRRGPATLDAPSHLAGNG